MSTWESKPIHVDGIDVQIHATAEGVTFGKIVDGVYSSDLLFTDTAEARAIGRAFLHGADVVDAARGAK